MNTRRGMGKGLGTGYKNIAPMDAHIHSLSAKGVKTIGVRHKIVKDFRGYIQEQEDNKIYVPNDVKKYVKSSLKKEEFFDKHLNAKGVDAQELKNALANFTGTEQYHKVSYTPVVATDGVAYLCEKAGAFWLVDAIGSYQTEKKFKDEHFQVWILKKEGKGAVLSAYRDYSEKNPNKFKPLVTQKIEYTDFPLDEIKLYQIDGVVLLPSEY